MEYRSEELSSLERSRDYSPIFKVVLRDGQGEEEDDEEPTCRKRGGCCVGGKVLVCGCGCICVGAGVGGCVVGECALHFEPVAHFTNLLTIHCLAYYLRNIHFVHLYTNLFVKCCGFMHTSRRALLRQTCLLQCGVRAYICTYHNGLKRWCDS